MLAGFKILKKSLSVSKRISCFSTVKDGPIIVEHVGSVMTIAINLPDNKNIIDETAYESLCGAFEKFNTDSTSTAAALYGVGGNFCSGCASGLKLDTKKLFASCKKPIVACMTGYATGFGFELALMCDLRVMEQTAQIGMNGYPEKLSDVFYERLVSTVGLSCALDLSLTGRNMSTKEAFQYGLVNKMVDCGAGIGQGVMLAKCVAKYPVELTKDVKAAIYSAIER